jgi:FkbM family methyltransferase
MSNWLKKIIIASPLEGIARRVYRFFNPVGEDVIGRKNAAYDEQTFAVMQRCLRKDSICVDVGCHAGAILKEMLRLAPAGTHYAFEPIPELYQKLIVSFPNVKVFDVALSDSVGEVSFQHVISNPGYSGLKKRSYDRPHESVEAIKVKTDLLDNIIPADRPISLIKIDVEGAELQVLRGAANTIRKSSSVIIFEHGLGAADCYGTTPEQVYDLLTLQCNLRVSLMEDWLKGDSPLHREGFAAQFYQGINWYFMAHPDERNNRPQPTAR